MGDRRIVTDETRPFHSSSDSSPGLAHYNPVMVRRLKTDLLLQTFKWPGRLRERGSDAPWFPVDYLAYLDHNGKRRSFTVLKQDGSDIPDGHYVFQDELGERSFRWRKWKGKWQFGWRYRATKQS